MQKLELFRLPKGFRGRPGWYVQLWWFVHATFFNLSPQYLYGWRRFILRIFGAKVGKGVLLRPSSRIIYPWKVSIGDHSWIGDDVVIYSLGPIDIGHDTVISQRSYICAAGHDYTKSDFPIYADRVEIGNEVWIATDVFVAPGVTIDDGSVVGARSSVFNDLPPGMVCMGCPAKPVRSREEIK